MSYFVLLYEVNAGFETRRMPFRAAHLRLVQEAHGRGDIVMAGALGSPPDRALLVFRAAEQAVVDAFARADPYVTNGLVTRWEVQPWAVVTDAMEQPGG